MYSLLGHELTAAKVFTAVALFTMLTGPLNAFPWVINGVVEATVSIRRVGEYLTLRHLQRDDYFASDPSSVGDDVSLTNATFSHHRHEMTMQFKLESVNFNVRHAEVTYYYFTKLDSL
jgi:ABC-type multidrug transport system fused ATPase/permease subunit